MDVRKEPAPAAAPDESNRTWVAILSASIISLLVWAFIIAFDVH
jgi:hypothetical protein